MAEIYKQEWKSPTSIATVYANAYRRGTDIIVDVTVACTLVYNNGYVNYIIAHLIALLGGLLITMIWGKMNIKVNK